MTISDINNYLKNLDSPFVLFLVGPPLSGKDTFIRNLSLNDTTVISRDDIVLELCDGMNYNQAFKSVNQKQVDKILKDKMINASNAGGNVIINMTNLRKKKRNSFKMKFGDNYKKIAVVFPILSDEEYQVRNINRTTQEGKTISFSIIRDMINDFESIDSTENFDKVINLKY